MVRYNKDIQTEFNKVFGKVKLDYLDHVACAHFNDNIIDFYDDTFGLVNFWEADSNQV